MAQITELSATATPGKRHNFSAKEEAAPVSRWTPQEVVANVWTEQAAQSTTWTPQIEST